MNRSVYYDLKKNLIIITELKCQHVIKTEKYFFI